MIIYPAIDIRNGKCVRLTEGDFARETIFGDDPAAMAEKWQSEGGRYLHVVDLDGAVAGCPVNKTALADILLRVSIPVQLGGGIRTEQDVEQLLELGVARVIVGSVAVRQPELVATLCRKYNERIVVGIDARDGIVAVEGWGKSGDIQADELACRMADVGVARIIYTDIGRDGTLAGVNIGSTAALAQKAGIPVIASGGVRGIEDIAAVKEAEKNGVEGVIVGKAIYTGTLSLRQAIALAEGE